MKHIIYFVFNFLHIHSLTTYTQLTYTAKQSHKTKQKQANKQTKIHFINEH